jgi:multiple sugar transport system substrate-binding protein
MRALTTEALSRRSILRLWGVALAGATLAACGGGAQPTAPAKSEAKPTEVAKPAESKPAETKPTPSSQSAAAPAGKAKGVTLRMLAWAGYKGDGLKPWLPDFEKELGGKVELDLVPGNNLTEKQMVTFSGKTGDFDLTPVDEPNLPAMAPFTVQLDSLVASDKLDKDDWIPVIWDAGVFEGKTYLIAFDPNVQILYARKDVLDAKGAKIPEKWTELHETARRVQEKEKDLAGVAIMAKRDIQTGINAWNYITTWGNEIFDADHRVAFDNEKSYEALAAFKKLIDEVTPQGILGYDYAGVNTAMQQGKVVFLQNWASVTLSIVAPPDGNTKVKDKVVFAPVLGQERRHSMRGVWSLGINADSKQREAAWEFTKWFTSKEGSLKYVRGGSGNSPRQSILKSPEFKQLAPHAEALATTIGMAKKRPIYKEYQEIQQVLDIMASKVTTGEAQPRDAVKEAATNLTTIMKRAGYQK